MNFLYIFESRGFKTLNPPLHKHSFLLIIPNAIKIKIRTSSPYTLEMQLEKLDSINK